MLYLLSWGPSHLPHEVRSLNPSNDSRGSAADGVPCTVPHQFDAFHTSVLGVAKVCARGRATVRPCVLVRSVLERTQCPSRTPRAPPLPGTQPFWGLAMPLCPLSQDEEGAARALLMTEQTEAWGLLQVYQRVYRTYSVSFQTLREEEAKRRAALAQEEPPARDGVAGLWDVQMERTWLAGVERGRREKVQREYEAAHQYFTANRGVIDLVLAEEGAREQLEVAEVATASAPLRAAAPARLLLCVADAEASKTFVSLKVGLKFRANVV